MRLPSSHVRRPAVSTRVSVLAALGLAACGGSNSSPGAAIGLGVPEGGTTFSQGDGSVAVGDGAVGVGDGAVGVGDGAVAVGDGAVAVGDGAVGVGDGGSPFGDGSLGDGSPPGEGGTATDGGAEGGADGGEAGVVEPLAKYGLTPLPISGEPLDVPDGEWTFLEFPDTQCRDGSPAGIALRTNPASNDLMIFLEGGGACFDDVTCLANPANTSAFEAEQRGGILNPDEPQNPVKDWNLVYVPYCTGDVHAGANPDTRVSDAFPNEQFVGYTNMTKFLQRVVPTFPNPDRVLLTGISAGGFGASSTAVLVQRAFPNNKVLLIDDSGPPQSADVVPPCLQDRMRDLWGLDKTLLVDCPTCSPTNFLQDFGVFLVNTFDDRPSGLIESVHDSVIAGFFGAGNNDCTGVALVTPVDSATFEKGLLDFRDLTGPSPNFGTYFPSGDQHTYLSNLMTIKFEDAEVGGLKLTQWVSDIVNGVGAADVGP